MSITQRTKRCRTYMLALILMLCSGCGLHLQQLSDYPTSLSTVYIVQPNTYDHGFTDELTRFFTRMHATITESQSQSPIIIRPSNIHYSSKSSALNSGSNATSTTYRLHVRITVLDQHHHQLLKPRTFASSQTISQNSTIINTSSKNSLMYSELTHNVIQRISAWLMSNNSQITLQSAIESTHDH